MNSEALTEVYDIINFMSDEYKNRIPITLKDFIKTHRDPLFKTNITKLPDTIDNLQEDTKVLLGIIYEKYFLNTDLDISEEMKKEIIEKCNNSKSDTILEDNSVAIVSVDNEIETKQNSLIDILKQFINKIKKFFKK